MRRRLFRGALLALILAGILPAKARGSVSISLVPPYIEKLVRSGSKVVDTISFTNGGTEALRVSVELADFAVGPDGEVAEAPPGTDATSLARYVRISPASLRVPPGQQVFFRYSVETPKEYRHLRTMIYFSCRPEVADLANQVVVVPRLGVPLYVENMSAEPASLAIDEVKWERSGEKNEYLKLDLLVRNEGERNIRPTGFLQVRSADGKFDRVFDFNEGREPVLPGQKRRWESSFGPVPEGELSLKLRFARSPRTTFDSESRLPAAGLSPPAQPSSSSR